jgi:hypothetical protein
VIERETGLEDTAETGVMLHADLSEELLASIFTPHAALHDGAVIVRGDRIVAAAAVLPLSEASTRERLGTRHRAALGITEQTDALAVVVSEETGRISLVEHGRAIRDLDEERLRARLVALLRPASGRDRAAAGISAIGRSTFGRGKRPRVLRGRRGGRVFTESAPGAAAAPAPAVVGAPAGTSGIVPPTPADGATPAAPPSVGRTGRPE